MQGSDPYDSVRRIIRLPPTINATDHSTLFQPLDHLPHPSEATQPVLDSTNQLVRHLNRAFEVWESPETFEFYFPSSAFPEVAAGETNMITYEQKRIVEQEDTFKPRLSGEQIAEIAETGQFKVQSNLEYITLPYVWKVNEALFWGRQRISKLLNSSLARVYGLFTQATRLVLSLTPELLQMLLAIPRQLFMLVFGGVKLTRVISANHRHEVFKDFWLKIMDNHYRDSEEWGSALWNYLHVAEDPQTHRPLPFFEGDSARTEQARKERQQLERRVEREEQAVQAKKATIEAVHQSFYTKWGKLKKIVIREITSEVESQALNASSERRRLEGSEEEILVGEGGAEEQDQRVLDLLADKKFSLYVDHMERELPRRDVPLDVTSAIVFLLRLFRVIEVRYARRDREEARRKALIEEGLKKKHTIRSLDRQFMHQSVTQAMKHVTKALDEQLYRGLLEDQQFRGRLSPAQLAAFDQFVSLSRDIDALAAAKAKQMPDRFAPARTFYSDYPLLPPYQVVRRGEQYWLKRKSEQLTVTTARNFWKVRLYVMRVKTWTITCLVYLFYNVWKGPLGLRCLWGVADFNEDMDINHRTGEVYYQQRKTVLGTFKKVLGGMRRSREHFEAQPDLGLLGKNISRVFNYIECYFLRLVVVGVVLVLLGYPLLILLSSVLTTLLVLTFWAWMPVLLLLTYLFNIAVYHFETTTLSRTWHMSWFPLLGFLLKVVGIVLAEVGIVLNLLLVAPLRTAFLMGYSLVVLGFRKGLDGLMLLLISRLGRTPSRDSNIARKVSGPGMSKEFYMSINEEDVYILVRARLERLFMGKLHQLTQQRIGQPLGHYQATLRAVLGVFGSSDPPQNYVQSNFNALNSNYQRQYSQYMARFPRNPKKVRFTQEEIDHYFDNTVSIVRSFVEKTGIRGWVYHDYELYEDMHDDLTRAIWGEIFGIGEEIFEPFEKLDGRFKLEDQFKNEDTVVSYSKRMKKQAVVDVLEGEVQLSHHHQATAPFRHNLLHREQTVEQISAILGKWEANRRSWLSLDLRSVKSLFVPHLDIHLLATIEREARERDIAGRNDLVDL